MMAKPKQARVGSEDVFWLSTGLFLTGVLAIGSLMFGALALRKAMSVPAQAAAAPSATASAEHAELMQLREEVRTFKVLVAQQGARLECLELEHSGTIEASAAAETAADALPEAVTASTGP
ncbi:MAG: hypothetical protein AMXMBFR7_21610 [Planctomycetota bacterium]